MVSNVLYEIINILVLWCRNNLSKFSQIVYMRVLLVMLPKELFNNIIDKKFYKMLRINFVSEILKILLLFSISSLLFVHQ